MSKIETPRLVKILLITPMMPPTAGGPATHAKKLKDYFESDSKYDLELFNFENLMKYPSGVRHIIAFIYFIFTFRGREIVFALDGYSVALPAVLAGKLLNKKVILRIGGDFIYENFLYIKEVNYEKYYENFDLYKKMMPKKLYIKYLIQKYITQNCYGIIFNTKWQKDIFEKHYNLENKKGNLYVIENPIEIIDKENISLENKNSKYIFTSITRDIPYKNQKRVKQAIENVNLQNIYKKIVFEYESGSHVSCLRRIAISRCYICASISDIAPNQVLEAVSLGIPIIMTKYSGLTDLLTQSGSVIFIDPQNQVDIENAIIELCDDERYIIYKKNAEKFRTSLQNRFTWKDLYKKYEIIINQSCIK